MTVIRLLLILLSVVLIGCDSSEKTGIESIPLQVSERDREYHLYVSDSRVAGIPGRRVGSTCRNS